ncbi:MAG TPA: hypothetical protein VFH45_12060 [Acidimicrobiales bacterium]|nr:hypothetical protein [Acidimicrobiales bacterium]
MNGEPHTQEAAELEAVMAHVLINTVGGIRGAGRILARRAASLSPGHRRDLLGVVVSGADHARQLSAAAPPLLAALARGYAAEVELALSSGDPAGVVVASDRLVDDLGYLARGMEPLQPT